VIENVVTFEDLPGYRPRRDLGLVSGSASRPRNVFRSTVRSLGMLLGLAPVESLSEVDELRADALAAMKRCAENAGANAVVGVHFRVAEEGGTCTVTAYGRAIDAEPNNERPHS
jgi:uncharacterized protein YbjQ (UPF0145 family)